LCAASLPSLARADGDPASDYLLGQNVFLPFDVKFPAKVTRELSSAVAEADKTGFKIRVAIIGNSYDLGAVPELFGKPQKYAQFLGQEIYFAYKGHLLVVMPNGFGFSFAGAPAPKLAAALEGLAAPGKDPTKLIQGAIAAIVRLAKANGHPIATPKSGSGGGRNATNDRLEIIGIVVVCLVLAGAISLLRRRTRKRGATVR
jgi:hypothetical protein